MTDIEALQRIEGGSQEALSWVMDKYGAYVSTIVWNIIGKQMSIADVEEVSADVFFALWNQAGKIQTNSLRGYVAGIARNMAKNKLREAGYDLALEDNTICLDGIPVEEVFARKEACEIVRRAVNAMKEPEREILLRYYFYYQTMDTISQEMGINLSTVKTKLRRSKDTLRHNLSDRLKY